MTASGRRHGFNTAAKSAAEMSGPRRLNLAARPSNVPCPMNTSHNSPVGLAAWVYALFQDVSDSGGNPEQVFSLDALLDDIMLYWLPNAGPSSARLYWETAQAMRQGGTPTAAMDTPTGISMFPGEQVRLSRRWAESRFAKLVHFGEPEHGGHFAALEQPAAFIDEVRQTFRTLR